MGGGMGGGCGFSEAYEAYEVKNKRQKLRCLLLLRKKIFFLYIYEVITWDFFLKRPSKLILLIYPLQAPAPRNFISYRNPGSSQHVSKFLKETAPKHVVSKNFQNSS